ncbi:MAG: penicillin-binding protein 1C [Treponema sp.]
MPITFIGGGKVFVFAKAVAMLPPLFFASIFTLCFTFLPNVSSPYSFAIYDKDENLLCASLSSDETYHLPTSQNINELYKASSIIYEDRAFFLHFGLDFSSIIRSFFLNIKEQKVVSGASTITMQLARLLCKHEKRTYLQKIKESLLALMLEAKYTKDEIFSLYASNAPFGGNVVGVDAASFRYFSTSQQELNCAQVAVLAVLPNQPSLVSLVNRRERLKEKRDDLIKKLYQYAAIDDETCDLSIAEPLPEKPSPLPFLAMHYHNLLKKEVKKNNARCITTIDYNLQRLAEEMAERHSQRLRENLVYNMAVVIMEVETSNVLAYVGNTGFFQRKNKNIYVDMANARRSSGSLLKPFLFASMLDRGMIFPSSLLTDIPTQIQSYAPENNNGKYEGAVQAMEALTKSLNVPFVRALREYGIPPFLELLKNIGFSTFNRKAEEYGLPLILGGGEITLYEACSVYAHLMRVAIAPDDDFPISQGAAYLTLNELTSGKRPYGEAIWESFSNKQKIAWKTGTSDGYKDAWSIGLTPKYVVGVWAGNADGVGRPEIKSHIATLPLMFELFNVLEKTEWLIKPEYALKKGLACAHSHYSKGMHCEGVVEEDLPINAPLPKLCPYCTTVCLSPDRKHRIEPLDIEGNEGVENWFVLPPSIEAFYAINHKQYKTLPPFLNKTHKSMDFEITFPENNCLIEIPIELSEKKGAFTAKVSHKNKDAILYWDIDGGYLGKTKTFHQFDITTSSGAHVLTVTDDGGNSKRVHFYVK